MTLANLVTGKLVSLSKKVDTEMRTILIATGLMLSVLAVGARAQPTLKAVAIPWSTANALTIGTGVDVDLIDQQRGTCLEQNATDVIWLDGTGATQTQSKMELVTSYESLTNTLNLEVDYKSKANLDFSALKAGGSLNLNVKYDTFAKDESRTLAIVFKAWSDYGRRGLAKYSLDTAKAKLIAEGKYAEFRAACGTHTIVAQHNEAGLAVVILLMDLTAESKRALETSFSTNFSAAGSVEAVKLSGSIDMQANWKTFMTTASRLSKVQVTFESKGGAGISDSVKVAVAPDPTRLDAILTALQSVSPSFTQSASVPVQYLLVSNSVFGLQKEVADAAKLDTLNGYYLQLAKVDFAISRIDTYASSFPALVPIYKTDPKVVNLRSYRGRLVDAIEACALRNECTYQPPKALGVLFAEDILTDTNVVLKCTYTRYNTPDGSIGVNVITNAAAILSGKARLVSHVGLSTVILTRLGPTSTAVRPMVTRWLSLSTKPNDRTDTAEILAQIDNQTFREVVETSAGAIRLVNEDQMNRALQDMLRSVYTIEIQYDNGISVVNTVGPPFGGNCPLTIRQNEFVGLAVF